MTTLKSNLLKKGKKGFTLTELAIVIAVIAILIAVLVPTFSSIITKAKVSNESVACKNEWTNFYIDADIAASGTSDNYLVVYTGNSYTDSSKKTYYHGYLAKAGVYDTETQLDVYVDSTSGIATCDKTTYYKPIGTYEYMAGDEIVIYTNSKTYSTIVTEGSAKFDIGTYTVTNSNITISGYNDTYYVTGTFTSSDNNSSVASALNFKGSTAFYVRIYFPVTHNEMTGLAKAQTGSGSSSEDDKKYYGSGTAPTGYTQKSTDVAAALDSSSGDAYAYVDCVLDGNCTEFTFDYYTGSGTSYALAGTITIYNNAN